jgi:hypothetical protein
MHLGYFLSPRTFCGVCQSSEESIYAARWVLISCNPTKNTVLTGFCTVYVHQIKTKLLQHQTDHLLLASQCWWWWYEFLVVWNPDLDWLSGWEASFEWSGGDWKQWRPFSLWWWWWQLPSCAASTTLLHSIASVVLRSLSCALVCDVNSSSLSQWLPSYFLLYI